VIDHVAFLAGSCVRCAFLVAPARAQQLSDTTAQDSVVVLTPIEVLASVRPSGGSDLAAIAPERVSVLAASRVNAYRPNTLPETLAQQPGISLYDDVGSGDKLGITARGFLASPVVGTPQGLSVFLDGIRENEPDGAEGNFDLLPMFVVRRVELLSGTASLQRPNSLGGVIGTRDLLWRPRDSACLR
jgi:iron complex outermembrane receptor protein